MYALNLADDGRVLSATLPEYAPEDAVTVETLPEGDVYEYRYVDGEFIHDPLPEPAAEQIAAATAKLRASDSDVLEALEGLLGCATPTDFIETLVAAGTTLKETLGQRRSLREQIAQLATKED